MMYNMEVFSHRILTYCFVKVNLGLDFLHFSLPLLCLRIGLKYCQAGMDFITSLTKHEKKLELFLWIPSVRLKQNGNGAVMNENQILNLLLNERIKINQRNAEPVIQTLKRSKCEIRRHFKNINGFP